MGTNRVEIGTGYPGGQLASAFRTAFGHEDAATRQRAEERLRTWRRELDGMSAGTLTVGSRTPVAGLPARATPQVVRGGFATGDAEAGGPPLPHGAAGGSEAQARPPRPPPRPGGRRPPPHPRRRHLDDNSALTARRYTAWATDGHWMCRI